MSLPNQLVPWRTFATLAAALEQPVVAPVFLVEVVCGRYEPVWLPYAAPAFYVGQPDEVTGVKVNGVALELAADASAAVGTPGSYFQIRSPLLGLGQNALIIHLADGGDPNDPQYTVETFLTYRLSDGTYDLGGYLWYPRVVDLPGLSTRITRDFSGGLNQIGGGTLTLANEDHFFDDGFTAVKANTTGTPIAPLIYIPGRKDQNWDAGQVVIRMGVAGLAYADFVKLATFSVASKARDDQRFTLELRERKMRLNKKYPFEVYTAQEFPGLRGEDAGRAKQVAMGRVLGVNPVCISISDCEFKVAGHPIHSFDGVRVLDNDTGIWNEVDFAAVDEANAIFRLDPLDWQDGKAVSVDFSGWVRDDATLMDNPAEIIEALVEEGGEAVNAAAFEEARLWYDAGYYSTNLNRITLRAPSLYLDTQGSLLTSIEAILRQVRAYLLVNPDGEFIMQPFRNFQGSDLPTVTEIDILEPGLRDETPQDSNKISKAIVSYAIRPQEGIRSVYTYEVPMQQYTRNQDEPVILSMDSLFVSERDAKYLAQSLVNEYVTDPAIYSLRLKWRPFLWTVAQHIHLVSERHGLDVVAEILETRVNLTSRSVDLRLGNLRGFHEASGFWVNTADVTPEGNSLAWPAGGQVPDDESQYKRHEAGHWHNDKDQATDTPLTARDSAVSRWQ